MKEIAVIIPVYKAHKTIKNTVSSLINQMGVDFRIYLSVDGEPQGSYDYIKEYYDNTDLIEILYAPFNGGAGAARQYALDHTTEPFIVFVDSDDLFNITSGLYMLRNSFKDNIVVVMTPIYRQLPNLMFKTIPEPMTWLHGKMYRRSYLDKYNIRFPKEFTCSNEDLGFNSVVFDLRNDNEQIFRISTPIYLWLYNLDSITVKDNQSFNWTKSLDGYFYHKEHAVRHVYETIGKRDDEMKDSIAKSFGNIYCNFKGLYSDKPGYDEKVNKLAKKYYKNVYPYIDGYSGEEAAQKSILEYRGEKDYEDFKKWKESLKED